MALPALEERDMILDQLKDQVDRTILEPCSPVEAKLANALAILISIVRHEKPRQ